MGMDIYGRIPTDEAGKYFCANWGAWRPLHKLNTRTGALPAWMASKMLANDGVGPKDQATCDELADRLERYTAEVKPRWIAPPFWEPPGEPVLEDWYYELSPDGYVAKDTLREWIEFLRHCGGFQVW